MKKLLYSLIFGLTFNGLIAQQLNTKQKGISVKSCGSDEIHNELMQNDPIYRQKQEAFEMLLKDPAYAATLKTGGVYKVPVVVHLMHPNEAVGTGTNLTDEQVKAGIDYINQRFRKIAGGLGDGNGEDIGIEFALAVRDENDLCTDGIVRFNMVGQTAYINNGVNRNLSSGMSDGAMKALSRWDPTKYYNIYVVNKIDEENCDENDGGWIAGYAYFASSHGNSTDGSVMLACTYNSESSTTFTHELGHAFNLYHTFEGDVNGTTCPTGNGDFCDDTPLHIRMSEHPQYATEYGNCSYAGSNTCDAGTTQDHMLNYMDYSYDACQNEFTADQKTRMVAAMTGARASFLESNGNESLLPVSTATVDFNASSTAVCTGSTVTFTDESACSPNTYINSGWQTITYSWTFDNGVQAPITSTDQNPTITFNNAGSYDVTLEVTNAHGTTSKTVQDFLAVANTATAACSPTSNNAGNFWQTIYNVSFNDINNSTNQYVNTAYTDFSCTRATTVTEGETYSLSISANAEGGSGNEVFEVYIDYNNNGSFLDAGELVFSGSAPSGTKNTYNQNVVIPGTAVMNTLLRMRVIGETGTLNNNERTCASALLAGDVEDYGVYIQPLVVCTDPDVPTISGTTTICNGNSTTLSINTGNLNDATNWQWYTSSCGGVSAGSGTSINISPSVTTTYYVRGEGGCVTPGSCAQVTVTVNDAPSITSNPTNSSINDGGNTSFSVTADNTTSYQWQENSGGGFGNISNGGVYSGATTSTLTITGATLSMDGNVYRCVVTGDCSPNATSNSATLTVNAAGSAPVADFEASETTVCEGSSIDFTDLSTNTPTGWSWSFPGGTPSSSTSQNPTITYNTAGTYQVTLTATNAGGNDNEVKAGYITVDETLGLVFDSTKIRVQDCGITLPNYTAKVYADIVDNATGYQFRVTNTSLSFSYVTPWYRKARWLRLSDIPGILPSTTYDIEVRARDGKCDVGTYGEVCQVTTSGQTVQTTKVIGAQCGATIVSSTAPVYAHSVSGATSYTFEVSNSSLSYSQTKTNGIRYFKLFQFSGLQPNTTYDVRVKATVGGVTGAYGQTCQITTPSSLSIEHLEARLGMNDEMLEDEMNTLETFGLVIYPNPNQGEYLFVELTDLSSDAELIVTDISGKQIQREKLMTEDSNYKTTIKFDQKLESGFYLVTVVSNGKPVTKKLIVR